MRSKSVGAVDGVEGLAQVVGEGVGSGDGLSVGLDLDLAVAEGVHWHSVTSDMRPHLALQAALHQQRRVSDLISYQNDG